MTISAAIIGVVNTGLAAVVTFGVNLSNAQTTAIVGVVNAILVLVSLILNPQSRFSVRQQPQP